MDGRETIEADKDSVIVGSKASILNRPSRTEITSSTKLKSNEPIPAKNSIIYSNYVNFLPKIYKHKPIVKE